MSADARVRELLRRIRETDGTPEEVCRDCPELLDEVRARWARLRAFDARLDEFFPGATDAGDAGPGREDAPAPEFPGYEVAEPLGAGGMGAVWKARELASGRLVALKVVHPHLRRLPGFAERLAREAQIGRQVVHENVVQTLGLATDATRAASRQALVTEYVEGQTLRALLGEMGHVPEQLCRHVGREIANGLAAIHAAGAVHRDLKPENVIIARCAAPGHDHVAEHDGAAPPPSDGNVHHRCDSVVKVMDLGVAKFPEAAGNLPQTEGFVGSLRYAAPEQIRRGGAALDGRADLYALGLTLYELSTGRYPFQPDEATRLSAADTPARRAGELNPQLSPLFEELVAKLMETDRERRFANAADVAGILEQGEESAWWRDRSSAIRGATRNPPRRIRIARETALHGREAELSLLRSLFDRASAGDGRVVLVEGEAGAGKSRLIDEFGGLLHRQGHDVHFVFGGYAPGGAATASGAFSAAYRELFGDQDLTAVLRRHLPECGALVPAFAALLRGEPPRQGTDALTKDALQTAFTRTTQALAAERPTVVVIEDLHFAPAEGRALFAALAHAVPGHRVLLAGTARETLDARWAADLGRLQHVSRLTVGRLGNPELTALLCDALRSAQVAEELAPQISGKSDGNPYFVFEILRDLRESRLLTPSADGGWRTAQTIRDIRSPSSITDLIAARIAELVPEEREMLEVAACCGFEFDPLLLGDVLGLARFPLLRRLGTLESAHRLVRSAGRRYVFDHHQVQEVLYARLSQMHRESYHAAIGSALERRSGAADRELRDLEGALCVDLAGHFLGGAEEKRALRYLGAALDHLEKGARNEAAARLLERALAVPGLLAGVPRFHALLRLASRIALCGRPADEARAVREANALADASGDAALQARARNDLGIHLARVSQNLEALEVLEESVALYRQAGNVSGEANATGNAGSVLVALGRHDQARIHFERRLGIALALPDRRMEAAALANLGNLFLVLGRPHDARTHLERGASLCRELGERRMEARAAGNLGNVYLMLGRFDEAQMQYEEILARSREFGDRLGEALATGNLAILFRSLGRYAEARAFGERCLALSCECAARTSEAIAAIDLGELLSSLGRHDEAQTLLERSLETARRAGARRFEGNALGQLGVRCSNLGRAADARAFHERHLALAREIGDRSGEAAALGRLGAAEAEAGRPDDAVRGLDASIAMAREVELPATLIIAASERARLPGGDPGAAISLLDEFGARAGAGARMHARWRLWQATQEPVHLADASRLLEFLVAHAPPDCRTPMVEHVRLHRDIRTAASPPPAS